MYRTHDYVHEPLYVVTPIFNPVRYKARWKHYERFAKMVKDAGGVLVTIEAAFGERHHALAEGQDEHDQLIHAIAPEKPAEFHKARSTNSHQYLRVRTRHELWIKENLINLAVSRLPNNWQYVAWVDADVAFANPRWVGATIHQLQHYAFVQMFSEAFDLGPTYETVGPKHYGFVSCYQQGLPLKEWYQYGGGYGAPGSYHPGYAWAARRDAWDHVGGLIDFAALGAGDNHMAHALIGQIERNLHPNIHPAYRRRALEWQYRAERHVRRNIGVVEGLLLHYWHGRKADRRYRDRWKILVENQYNPDTDLKPDWQGVHQLVDRDDARTRVLRDQMREYFRARNEDSIDV